LDAENDKEDGEQGKKFIHSRDPITGAHCPPIQLFSPALVLSRSAGGAEPFSHPIKGFMAVHAAEENGTL
jgi:hypothetical protein